MSRPITMTCRVAIGVPSIFWLGKSPDGGVGASVNPPRACGTCGAVIALGVVRTLPLGGTRWDCPEHAVESLAVNPMDERGA